MMKHVSVENSKRSVGRVTNAASNQTIRTKASVAGIIRGNLHSDR